MTTPAAPWLTGARGPAKRSRQEIVGRGSFKAFAEEVRQCSNLVEIIGGDVELRRTGSVLRGLSPFHAEAHPSFIVWPETQSWHDYSNGGGVGGDVFAYVQRRDKVGFKEAVFTLAQRAGLAPSRSDKTEWAGELAWMEERQRVEQLLTLAATYYHRTLPPEVRDEYYKRRYGFTDATVDQLQLGWADGGLYGHLARSAGASRRQLLGTGLFVPLRGGGTVDFFRNRLVFPFWRGGRVVYFSARATAQTGNEPWEQAKYRKLRVHSEQQRYISPTVRNDYFFNEDAAGGADELVLTEGIPDCISAWQAGVACVSPTTTSLGDKSLARLVELTARARRVIICNDSEVSGAGERSAAAIARHLWSAGREACLALIPRPEGAEKVDLNELAIARGASALREVLDGALPYPEYLLAQVPSDTPKSELTARIAPVLAAVRQCAPLRGDTVLDAVASRFQVRRRLLLETMRQLGPGRAKRRGAAPRGDGGPYAQQNPTAASPPPGGRGGPASRPELCVTGRHPIDLLLEARDLVGQANKQRIARATDTELEDDEVPLFRRGNLVARLERLEETAPRLAQVSETAMYGVLMREISWVRATEHGTYPIYPPDKIARDLLVHPGSTFPRVNAVITSPTFGRDGALLVAPGLHARDRLWLEPDPSLQVPEVPGHPTRDEIAAARALFFDDLLVDFPFASVADRAHALAAFLLPFMHRLIDGCTPLHVMEAPGVGSGKGLLCNLISIVLTGAECAARTLPESEDEVRKMLTSELLGARPLVLIDNARDSQTITSSALASVLTARSWSDRILGRNEMVAVPNNSMWMLTGNNPSLSRDLARRAVRIRIEPTVDTPWLRTGFKHDPIEAWVKGQRSALVHAGLVLVQAWIAAEQPLSRTRMGSFQVWANIMGGVLDVIEVPGFLQNREKTHAIFDEEETAWRPFTLAWWKLYGAEPVRVARLLELCQQKDLLPDVIKDGTTRAQQVRLGCALQRTRNRVFDDLKIIIKGRDRDSRTLYAVERIASDAAPSPAETDDCLLTDDTVQPVTGWLPYSDNDDDDDDDGHRR